MQVTPASGASLFPLNKSHNTWNGPIMGPYEDKYHMFLPYYGNYTGVKSLFRVECVTAMRYPALCFPLLTESTADEVHH
jgi:hypothetical protein